MNTPYLPALALTCSFLTLPCSAQVNSGSDGHDGALNPTANVTIDMADHPDGIYQYTSVNIPTGVTLTFKPNTKNTPVVWLVQGDCVIGGTVDISGQAPNNQTGGVGGVGGGRGGNGGSYPTDGQGIGGGKSGEGGGSYATSGYPTPGPVYGNKFILPLQGGSGGGASANPGGGGGGGAILIASSSLISVNGLLNANGGNSVHLYSVGVGGAGSGGGIRLVAPKIDGGGTITSAEGFCNEWGWTAIRGGSGRVRFDVLENRFAGGIGGSFTQGFQPIIIPASGQGIQLAIASIAGSAVSAVPSGVLANPDVIIPALQSNPIPVVVSCTNVPLNSEITVIVHPANGTDVQAVGMNNAGTLNASTATVSLNMPRGGGIIYAKCVSGLTGLGANTSSKELRTMSLAQTGWTAEGERFAKMEVTATLGGKQQIAYITESGKRYAIAAR